MMLFEMEDYAPDIDECKCLPDCNTIEYQISVMKSEIKPEDRYVTVNNISQYIGTEYYSALSFSFGDIEYHALKRYANYGTTSFISDVGGLLGLFLGVSVISFIEIFYFFGLRVVVECMKHLKRNHKTKKISQDLTATLNEINN